MLHLLLSMPPPVGQRFRVVFLESGGLSALFDDLSSSQPSSASGALLDALLSAGKASHVRTRSEAFRAASPSMVKLLVSNLSESIGKSVLTLKSGADSPDRALKKLSTAFISLTLSYNV